jgi:hypothetical protein
VQVATPVGAETCVTVQLLLSQLFPDEAVWFAQDDTKVGPVVLVRQVVAEPPEELGVQVLVPTQPVSEVWQLTVLPFVGPEGEQDVTLTQPVSEVWQETVDEGVQPATLLHDVAAERQSTAEPLPV